MSAPTILEGTWEEICKHDSELAGRFVRLMIMPDSASDGGRAEDQRTLVERFKAQVSQPGFEPIDLAERAEDYLAEGFGDDPGEKGAPR